MRLLAVHAHPDDETLSSGALLAAWSRAGHEVTLVTCTRGERGEVIGAELAHLEGDGPALAAHREQELAAALDALGVQEHHFLDALAPGEQARYEDSGMSWVGGVVGTAGLPDDVPSGALVSVPLDTAASHLAALVVEQRPAVVVTYDAGGGYGHPDHVRAHEITVRALELAAPRLAEAGAVTPVLVCPSFPSEALRAQRRALASEPWARDLAEGAALVAPDPDADLPAVASDDRTVALEVDVRDVVDRVTGALRAHATQVKAVTLAPDGAPVLGAYALSNDVLAAVPAVETYAILAGDRAALGRVLTAAAVPGVRAVA
ncbi:N-acetyl-1-D-myo-inositol-2-amino-2-deoxy-alpha-D-glucopyranoside deacetylase [Flavimobilis soli]|uniref:N-acetyl-1-D-myo-inositol-2-amino-2-deoxy-alpha-D-glucopyranoside deacetylase n=1 Tax=Flavimobilis soli TaxID=442709 RepID=A0A2A9ED16_9MICO|nr:PIG-L family deacetylase [Flavimobilis soli]PFG36165.1 N-acetyl-1-D-myo-inositol-2-amino-2-deoxy-alpha-D-glucopyranoside deacetylase [Flavimobilis soli]